MTVTLTAEQEEFIAEQMKSGHYGSAADVIAQNFGMLRAQEELIQSKATEFHEKIARGMEQIRRGEVAEGQAAFQNLRNKLRGGQ